MKITLLQDQLTQTVLVYIFLGLAALLITYFFFRWIFAITERVRQNQIIINLLVLTAKKQGATDEQIHSAVNPVHKT